MPKFRPTRPAGQSVHIIEALGGFRAVSKVVNNDNGPTVQSWTIENGVAQTMVTVVSTQQSDSTFAYTNTGSADIADDGKIWKFAKHLDQDEEFQPAPEVMVPTSQPKGRIVTNVSATTTSRVKNAPLPYGSPDQHLDWH